MRLKTSKHFRPTSPYKNAKGVNAMSETEPYSPITTAQLEELDRLGSAIYERLKPLLEPEYNRKSVAIHVDSEDYVVERNSSSAMRAMLKIHPADGRLYIRKIGDEPECRLIARMQGGNMRVAEQK